jgi:hypothetical protein
MCERDELDSSDHIRLTERIWYTEYSGRKYLKSLNIMVYMTERS